MERLQAARLFLSRRAFPYLSSALFSLSFREDDSVSTIGVNEEWIATYNPQFIASIPMDQLRGVLYHEVQHLLRNYFKRRGSRDHTLFNIAADMAINDDIVGVKDLSLPEWVSLPGKFGFPDGLLDEEYYDLLTQQQEKGSGGSKICGGDCVREEETGEGLSPIEGEMVRRKVAQDIQSYQTNKPGSVPADWVRWANAILGPQVPWERELRSAVRSMMDTIRGSVDYSFSRPNRRQAMYGDIIMPSMIKPIVQVATVIDTSGSMNEKALASCLGEVKGIIKACGQPQVPVLSVDCQVHGVQRVRKADRVALKGGGGTNMRVGIEAAMKLRPKPNMVIVLTDGYTGWGDTPPPVKTVVCIVGSGPNVEGPQWARTIHIT